jgi:hypothetical protein
MKIKLMMKTPDAIEYAIDDAVEAADIPEEDVAEVKETIREKLAKWFKYGEVLSLEFDISLEVGNDEATAKVIEVK